MRRSPVSTLRLALLFTLCAFYALRFLRCALFSLSAFYALRFFRLALFTLSAVYALRFLRFALFSLCAFYALRFFRFALFALCAFCALRFLRFAGTGARARILSGRRRAAGRSSPRNRPGLASLYTRPRSGLALFALCAFHALRFSRFALFTLCAFCALAAVWRVRIAGGWARRRGGRGKFAGQSCAQLETARSHIFCALRFSRFALFALCALRGQGPAPVFSAVGADR